MKTSSAAVFWRDRLSYIAVCALIVGFGVSLMLLEQGRYPGYVQPGTIYYFIVLSIFLIILWLLIDYLRQKAYFRQMGDAIRQSGGELQSPFAAKAVVTGEQRLVAQLWKENHAAYLNELCRYRRQQELHNHFVLQWVHHMKTPVSVIDLLAQDALQQMPVTEEERRELIASMQEEAERMARGLDMMLHTARLDKFELDVHIARTPLHELVRTVMNTHKRLCIRHSIFPVIEGEAWVETDAKWMSIVLNQFITNAIKYSKSKSGQKKIHFHLEAGANRHSKLIVRDEGIGIAAHDMPRIFDPFFTGENGRLEEESTGMGLYLAKQVCQRLGHGLSVESELGVGTAFTITFAPDGIHLIESES